MSQVLGLVEDLTTLVEKNYEGLNDFIESLDNAIAKNEKEKDICLKLITLQTNKLNELIVTDFGTQEIDTNTFDIEELGRKIQKLKEATKADEIADVCGVDFQGNNNTNTFANFESITNHTEIISNIGKEIESLKKSLDERTVISNTSEEQSNPTASASEEQSNPTASATATEEQPNSAATASEEQPNSAATASDEQSNPTASASEEQPNSAASATASEEKTSEVQRDILTLENRRNKSIKFGEYLLELKTKLSGKKELNDEDKEYLKDYMERINNEFKIVKIELADNEISYDEFKETIIKDSYEYLFNLFVDHNSNPDKTDDENYYKIVENTSNLIIGIYDDDESKITDENELEKYFESIQDSLGIKTLILCLTILKNRNPENLIDFLRHIGRIDENFNNVTSDSDDDSNNDSDDEYNSDSD